MLRHAVIECALSIKLTDVGSENYRSAYLGDGSDKMVEIIRNIHQVTELCQRKFPAKSPGTAAYLLNNRRLISADQREKPGGIELNDASVLWEARVVKNSIQSAKEISNDPDDTTNFLLLASVGNLRRCIPNLRSGGHRQRKSKPRAFARLACHPDFAPMQLDKLLG
ncbi:MAG: hypothetical protein K0Q83_2790 [Deltaproteobacteria bacterium]|nr:hypothetical protein [Deltaproteobacteria bacterium]